MKKILLLTFIISGFVVSSQITEDLSLGIGYESQVYYSLENGVQKTVSLGSWDLAFSTSSFGSSIRFNGATGSELYVYERGTTSAWSTLDTAGLSQQASLYDSDTSWSSTAFNKTSENALDLGWGTYSVITHIVSGDSVYIFKSPSGDYKKFYIERLQSRTYYLVQANLDGSDSSTVQINKNEYSTKNHVYYSFKNKSIIDLEPESDSWDLLFTKYVATLRQGLYYGVTGVLLNTGVTSGKVVDGSTIDEISSSSHNYELKGTLNSIGFDWKSYSFIENKFVLTDSLIFVVKDKQENEWNLEFLSFSGSTSGDLSFNKMLQSKVTGIFNSPFNKNKMSIYPNPVKSGSSIQVATSLGAIKSYKIYNQDGDILFITTDKNQLENKTRELTKGLYLVELQTNNTVEKEKLIIN